MNNQDNKWVLITGGAKRIGAEVARTLHARGMNLAVHYNSSNQDAESLSNELNGIMHQHFIPRQLTISRMMTGIV